MAPTITPSTSIRRKIRRNASSSPCSPVAAVSRIRGIRIASAWRGVRCRFGVWKSIQSRSSGTIGTRCVTSQHGRHLPLGADVIQPLHVVDEVARRTNAYIAPPIPYGVCTTTRPYPGTVSVSVDALKAFVRDVLSDFVRNGVRRVMILSGHAGREHMMALRAAAQEVVEEGTGLKATVLSDYDIIYASHGILPEGDGHAGAGETSRILTARPDLVKGKSPAGKNDIPPYAVVDDPRKYWSGVTGDPSKASKALGQKLDDLVIDELVRLVEELRRRA